MDIGIVAPNAAAGVDGPTLVQWARRAEERGFASIGVIGRVAYPTYEELVTLAAMAGATQRIKLLTTTLLAPLRDPVFLAKQAAALDGLSAGRLVLGLSSGMRQDDYAVVDRGYDDRGKRFDAMLDTMHALWRGERPEGGEREACPPLVNGRIPLYFGALTPAPRIMRRIAKWGDGYIAVGPPVMVQPIIDAVREAWDGAGREGRPKVMGASYFVLGDEHEAERNILEYYGDFYPQLGNAAAAAMLRTPETAKRVLEIHREAGFDHFNFSASATDPLQVDRLADAIF